MEQGQDWSRWLGFGLLFTVVLLWVGSGLLIQHIETNLAVGALFLTYFSTTIFVVLLPYGLYRWQHTAPHLRKNMFQLVVESVQFGSVWFVANALFNLGLKYTSVASSSVMSSISSGFVLFASWLLLDEVVTWRKLAACALCSTGIIVVSLCDKRQASNTASSQPLLGDVFTLVGAGCYGLYSVLLKRQASSPTDEENLPLFFGLIGALTSVGVIPLLFLAHLFGLERFEESANFSSRHVVLLLSLNALFGTVVSDLVWAHSVRLLGAVVPAVGLGLTIPTSILAQVALGQAAFSVWYVIGAAVTLSGFILVALPDRSDRGSEGYEIVGHEETDDMLDDDKQVETSINIGIEDRFLEHDFDGSAATGLGLYLESHAIESLES
eukprot:TRINITY_DN9790_c0_g2_i3.p1 TRINITY_DN9790_c0_g2~~TRINITY_DN9790_c0_g2_i3.p1  ORF type:complete len:382 (+),score=61.80 TRINITY_DN9790_c0_g2_i3:233-1378(+)